MTREEILINTIWTVGKLMVYSPFFNREIRISLITSEYNLNHTKTILSDKFVQAINDFLQLSEVEKPLMQKLIFQHCQDCCKSISYGFDVQEGENETAANLRAFGITNEIDAFQKSNLDHILIREDEGLKNRYAVLVFYPPWEQEHGCELILKNGKLLNFCGANDTFLAQFEEF